MTQRVDGLERTAGRLEARTEELLGLKAAAAVLTERVTRAELELGNARQRTHDLSNELQTMRVEMARGARASQ